MSQKVLDILLQKNDARIPWGFSLSSGPDGLILIDKVWPGALACQYLNPGDRLLSMDGINCANMSVSEASQMAVRPATNLHLLVAKRTQVSEQRHFVDGTNEYTPLLPENNSAMHLHDSKGADFSKRLYFLDGNNECTPVLPENNSASHLRVAKARNMSTGRHFVDACPPVGPEDNSQAAWRRRCRQSTSPSSNARRAKAAFWERCTSPQRRPPHSNVLDIKSSSRTGDCNSSGRSTPSRYCSDADLGSSAFSEPDFESRRMSFDWDSSRSAASDSGRASSFSRQHSCPSWMSTPSNDNFSPSSNSDHGRSVSGKNSTSIHSEEYVSEKPVTNNDKSREYIYSQSKTHEKEKDCSEWNISRWPEQLHSKEKSYSEINPPEDLFANKFSSLPKNFDRSKYYSTSGTNETIRGNSDTGTKVALETDSNNAENTFLDTKSYSRKEEKRESQQCHQRQSRSRQVQNRSFSQNFLESEFEKSFQQFSKLMESNSTPEDIKDMLKEKEKFMEEIERESRTEFCDHSMSEKIVETENFSSTFGQDSSKLQSGRGSNREPSDSSIPEKFLETENSSKTFEKETCKSQIGSECNREFSDYSKSKKIVETENSSKTFENDSWKSQIGRESKREFFDQTISEKIVETKNSSNTYEKGNCKLHTTDVEVAEKFDSLFKNSAREVKVARSHTPVGFYDNHVEPHPEEERKNENLEKEETFASLAPPSHASASAGDQTSLEKKPRPSSECLDRQGLCDAFNRLRSSSPSDFNETLFRLCDVLQTDTRSMAEAR